MWCTHNLTSIVDVFLFLSVDKELCSKCKGIFGPMVLCKCHPAQKEPGQHQGHIRARATGEMQTCFQSPVSRSLLLWLLLVNGIWMLDSHTQLWKFTPSAQFLIILPFFFSPPSREDGALSVAEINFRNWNGLSTNVNFIKATFNTNQEFSFIFRGTVSTSQNRSPWPMNAHVHRHKIAVMGRLKPYPVLILSPNSDKWTRISHKVRRPYFIDLLEFILFFLTSLLLHLCHTQTLKLP